MELKEYFGILGRYWRFIAIAVGFTVLSVFAVSYLFDDYTATATVQVLPGQSEAASITRRTSNNQDLAFAGPDPREVLLNNASETLKSRPVAEGVVTFTELDTREKSNSPLARGRRALAKTKEVGWSLMKYAAYRSKPKHEANVDAVQGSLSGTVVRNSFVLKISSTTSDPLLSRDIANAAVNVLQLQLQEQARESAQARVDTGRSSLDVARADLKEARAQVRSILTPAEPAPDAGLAPTDALALRSIDSRLAESQAELDTVTDQLASLSTASNLYAQLQPEKLSLERQIASLQAERLSITNDNGLTETLTNASIAGDTYLRRASQLEQAEDDLIGAMAPLRILAYAEPPLYPTGVIRLYWVLGALAMSLSAAVAIAFALDYFDTSVRSARQVESLLGVPALATVSASALRAPQHHEGKTDGNSRS